MKNKTRLVLHYAGEVFLEILEDQIKPPADELVILLRRASNLLILRHPSRSPSIPQRSFRAKKSRQWEFHASARRRRRKRSNKSNLANCDCL